MANHMVRALPVFLLLLMACFRENAQPQIPAVLEAALDGARNRIWKLKPQLTEQQLQDDANAVIAARATVFGLYVVGGVPPEKMYQDLVDRWQEIRAGEFAIPTEWTLDRNTVIRYGLAVEAARERISAKAFVDEATALIDAGRAPQLIRSYQVAISDALPDLVKESRGRGLSAAQAYTIVIELYETLVRRAYRGVNKNLLLDLNSEFQMLTVDSTPRRALVRVDGVEWDRTPTGNFVPLGSHKIQLSLPGHVAYVGDFEVSKDSGKNVFKQELERVPAGKKR